MSLRASTVARCVTQATGARAPLQPFLDHIHQALPQRIVWARASPLSGPSMISRARPWTADQARNSAPWRRAAGSTPASTIRSSATPRSWNGLRPLLPALAGSGEPAFVRPREHGAEQPGLAHGELQIAEPDGAQARPRQLGRAEPCAQGAELRLHRPGKARQRRHAHRPQQLHATREVPVGGIRHHPGPSRGLAQHDRVGTAGLRQRDASLQQNAAQIAVPIRAACRRFGILAHQRARMWTASIFYVNACGRCTQ